MSYFASTRCKLYYEDTAESDPSARAKQAVLFVNGWAISSRYWKPLVDILSVNYRCITYDQSGTGKTIIKGYQPTFTIQGFTDEAAELIEHLGLQSSRTLHIVGHSMGGMVATELCLRYRNALLSATIIACGIFEETPYTSLGLFFLGVLICYPHCSAIASAITWKVMDLLCPLPPPVLACHIGELFLEA